MTIKTFNKLEKWWDNGMGLNLDRKFSLLVSMIWIYTLLIMGLFNKLGLYVAIPLGLFFLSLDDHNLN